MKQWQRKKESTPGENLARQIIEQDNPKSVADMPNALKDIFGPMFEAMLQGEMNSHLGYASNDHGAKSTTNRRNGYTSKDIKTSVGEVSIKVPRDREGNFEPKIVKKRQKDVSAIEEKVLAMYARGMSQRDIAETIEDIYGFEISHETLSEITDCVLNQLNDWQNRLLKKMYTFLFVDCMYVTIRKEYESKNYAVYTILGYDTNGEKDILGLWLNESESKHTWMQIFDELKARGAEDILFICMNGVSGLEDGAKAIFKNVVVQRCIVHLIRNSIKYIPSKDYKKFTQSLKKVYGAPSLNASRKAFEQFCQEWSQYPGAVDVWKRNFNHVEQLFDYGSAVRKVMYTTNAIENINSSFRKVTKKGTFPNENALLKLLYLRITELYRKCNGSKVQNWAMVRNQLVIDDKIRTTRSAGGPDYEICNVRIYAVLPYVSAIFDCFALMPLGLSIEDNMKASLCCHTLENASKAYPDIAGCIIHSDRGSQYTSSEYREVIKKYGILQSMNSDGGRSHDNAHCESMWARMKEELFYSRNDRSDNYTISELKTMIWRYYMSYWANRRICTANGGLPPAVKRLRYYQGLNLAA